MIFAHPGLAQISDLSFEAASGLLGGSKSLGRI
jgi:hypothetical protein